MEICSLIPCPTFEQAVIFTIIFGIFSLVVFVLVMRMRRKITELKYDLVESKRRYTELKFIATKPYDLMLSRYISFNVENVGWKIADAVHAILMNRAEEFNLGDIVSFVRSEVFKELAKDEDYKDLCNIFLARAKVEELNEKSALKRVFDCKNNKFITMVTKKLIIEEMVDDEPTEHELNT